jgi:predicted nucleic acid-binding protein
MLFVDTSVWSLALRRDHVATVPEIETLRRALDRGDTIVITGLVLQELLQGFSGPRGRTEIIDRFAAPAPCRKQPRTTTTSNHQRHPPLRPAHDHPDHQPDR